MTTGRTSDKSQQSEHEIETYLLDLQGYLVVDQALSAEEVSDLNRVIDAQLLPPPTTYNRFGSAPLGSGFLRWDHALVQLLDHQNILRRLELVLGDTFVVDRIFGVYEERFVGNRLVTDPRVRRSTESANEKRCVVLWNLADTGLGIGGFCCIAGSHRLDRDPPQTIAQQTIASRLVMTPDAATGSAIIYRTSLAHGNAIWHGPHQRRTLVLEYVDMNSRRLKQRVVVPTNIELSDSQRSLLGA